MLERPKSMLEISYYLLDKQGNAFKETEDP